MNLMKLFGFDDNEDDYDSDDDFEDRRKKPSVRKDNTSRSGSSGRLILFKVRHPVAGEDKRRLCDELGNGTMILVDMNGLTPRDFDEFGREFLTFMEGATFSRGGTGKMLESDQFILIPRTGIFEVWPKEDTNE